MEVQEFGKQNSRKIMLLPGSMMSWRQFEAVIPLLEKQYHVIAVSTDGYDDTGKTTFTTAEAMPKSWNSISKKNRMVPSTGAWRIHGRRNGRYTVPPAKS